MSNEISFIGRTNTRIMRETLSDAYYADIYRKMRIQNICGNVILRQGQNEDKKAQQSVFDQSQCIIDRRKNQMLHKQSLKQDHIDCTAREKEIVKCIKETDERIMRVTDEIAKSKQIIEIASKDLSSHKTKSKETLLENVKQLKAKINKIENEKFFGIVSEKKPCATQKTKGIRDLLLTTSPRLPSITPK